MENVIITGRKLNMSQVFMDDGRVVPVTLVGNLNTISQELEKKPIVITGKSKGKGFAGVMKKWGFAGLQATRGQSTKPRAPGSIGGQTPGRVLKGKKMAGRMGNKRISLKGLQIVKVDMTANQIFVSGPIPGARNSQVKIKVL